MPLSFEQRLELQSLIENHTLYSPSARYDSGNGAHYWHGTYIIDSIETIMDSSRQRTRDLCLPESFIRGRDKAQFWFDMAAVASGMNEFYWHEIEYEIVNRYDSKQRYVYTWAIGDATIKFYTKTFHTGGVRDLRWYVCRFADDESNVDSGCDTDSEDVMLDE
jgi:hypothetical protein